MLNEHIAKIGWVIERSVDDIKLRGATSIEWNGRIDEQTTIQIIIEKRR